jgi:TPR repeat protein
MAKRLLQALILFLSFSGLVFPSEDKKQEMQQIHKEPTEILSDHELDEIGTERIEMLKKLAEEGNADAQHRLADSYYHGKDFSQNHDEAFKWYKKSAEQGYVESQYNLGGMYYEGKGVAQNYTEAIKWFKKAAEQGDVEAQFVLGGMYYNGLGVPQNHIESYVWCSMAAAKGHKAAINNLYLIKSEMTSEQIAEAQKKAAALWEKISKNN